ncbi:hypothetical protein RYX36_006150 [Vicia faba]
MNIHIPISILQQDINLSGLERFGNDVLRDCKVPQPYIPFGIGARVSVGQHFSMIELKKEI